MTTPTDESDLALHEQFMAAALDEAQKAMSVGEVPVGAVVVLDGSIIARGHNVSISMHDPAGHAEIRALKAAADALGNYRLPGCRLYVTIEPCTMCVGAMIHARIQTVVFGAREPRAGAVVSAHQLLDSTAYNHKVDYLAGVCQEACADLVQGFFRARRLAKK